MVYIESYGNCQPNLGRGGESRKRQSAHASAGSPHSPPCLQAMEQGILKLGRGGECRRRPTAHASAGSLCPYKEVFN